MYYVVTWYPINMDNLNSNLKNLYTQNELNMVNSGRKESLFDSELEKKCYFFLTLVQTGGDMRMASSMLNNYFIFN